MHPNLAFRAVSLLVFISCVSFYIFLFYIIYDYDIAVNKEVGLPISLQIPYPSGNGNRNLSIGWQHAAGSNDTFVVYSAHYVKPDQVRVIAATLRLSSEKAFCIYWENISHLSNQPSTNLLNIKLHIAYIKTMTENHALKYSGKFINCPLPEESDWKPKYVSIVVSSSRKLLKVSSSLIQNYLPIRYPPENGFTTNFSVCVKPIYNFTNTVQFVEWFEFYKLMGVRHFTFFVLEVGNEMSCILHNLQRASNKNASSSDESIVVEVIPWANYPFNYAPDKLIRGGPQGLSEVANECVYRHKGVSEYMVFVDLDEMIVPHRLGAFDNYHQLIKKVDAYAKRRNNGAVIGSYTFKNTFFKDISPPKFSLFASGYHSTLPMHLNTLKRTVRMKQILQTQRSKYICNPNSVNEAGTHFIWSHNSPYQGVRVAEGYALLHHYRVHFKETDWSTTVTVKDETAVKYGVKIEGNVRALIKTLEQICKQ